ncbi:MAG: hypothetical protein QXW37_07410 [Candidatus Nitrosotenuis sp.]
MIALFAIVVFAAVIPSIPMVSAQGVDDVYNDKTPDNKFKGRSCPCNNRGITT